jgi:hypothetical protein
MFEVGAAVTWRSHPHIKNDIPDGSVGTITGKYPRGFRQVKFWYDPIKEHTLPILQLRGVDV